MVTGRCAGCQNHGTAGLRSGCLPSFHENRRILTVRLSKAIPARMKLNSKGDTAVVLLSLLAARRPSFCHDKALPVEGASALFVRTRASSRNLEFLIVSDLLGPAQKEGAATCEFACEVLLTQKEAVGGTSIFLIFFYFFFPPDQNILILDFCICLLAHHWPLGIGDR